MKTLPSLIKRLGPIYGVIVPAMALLWLSLVALENFTTKSITTPISPAPVLAGPPVFSASVQLQPNRFTTSNPVATAFINAWPDGNGYEVYVHVTGVKSDGSPIFLNVDPGTGPGSHRDSNAMTISGTTYVATAIGFAPEEDAGDGDDTMSITTTVGSQVMSTGDINFHRAYISATVQYETVRVDDGDFELEMPNEHTLPHTKAYVLAMSTNVPPGPLPIGYRLASSTYNVRPSHSLTQSAKLMNLNLRFAEPLLGGSDPHTLAIVGWDPLNKTWDVLGGNLFDDDDLLNLATKRFRIYALATTPTWRDSFKEWSLTGVLDLNNTQWGPGDTIILGSAATSGTVTSIPIAPTGAANWGTLHFSATTSLSTSLTVDVLNVDDNVVLADVSDGADLSGLPPATYPSLRLRATLTRTETTEPSPRLHEWQVGWVPEVYKVYLPLLLKN